MKSIFISLMIGILAFGCKKESDTKTDGTNNENGVPSVTTLKITDITGTSANVVYSNDNANGSTIQESGICYSNTNSNPTISDSRTSDGTALGQITSAINGLTPKTLYYIRAYSKNANGTGYGGSMQFTTISLLTSGTYLEKTNSDNQFVVTDDNIVYNHKMEDGIWYKQGDYEYRGKLVSNPSTNFVVQGNWYNYLNKTPNGMIDTYIIVQQKDATTIIIRGGWTTGYESAYNTGTTREFSK